MTAPPEAESARRAELARMRALATGLLAAMTALFVGCRFAPAGWPAVSYVSAFAEAAMVGACADWFAVTALFRRPLGLPIPHTAIIPRNKARIGAALGDFIGGEFLTPRVLDRTLREQEPAWRLAAWLGEPGVVDTLSERGAALLADIAPLGAAARDVAGEMIRRAARAGPLFPLLGRLMDLVWREPSAARLLDRTLAALAAWVADHKTTIEDHVAGRAWAWLPKWVDRLLAEKIAAGLAGAIADLADPDHPSRQRLGARIEALIDRLQTDPDLIARGEALKARLLADETLRERAHAAWSELATLLPGRGVRDLAAPIIGRALAGVGDWLREDPAGRQRLDSLLRVALRQTLSPRRREIGAFVARVVDGWDAREAVAKLELQVGRDLQYIRINGTLVGGLVGLTIHAISQAFPAA